MKPEEPPQPQPPPPMARAEPQGERTPVCLPSVAGTPLPGPRLGGRQPRFFWQAVLIVLPVLVLAIVGLFSLRRDRLLAEQEARQRAGEIAQEIADRVAVALLETGSEASDRNSARQTTDRQRPVFEMTPQLELRWPQPVESPPTPRAVDRSGLAPDAQGAWTRARQATLRGDHLRATNEWLRFLAADLPEHIAAEAVFEAAQAAVRAGDIDLARAQLQRLVNQYPRAVAESGLPLAPLALWREAELELDLDPGTNAARRRLVVESACSNLVHKPTMLTPLLLRRLEELVNADMGHTPGASPGGDGPRTIAGQHSIAFWRELWQRNELARALFVAARAGWLRRDSSGERVVGIANLSPSPDTASIESLWVELDGSAAGATLAEAGMPEHWLVARLEPTSSALRFQGWKESEVTDLVTAEVRRQGRNVPAYFAVAVSVAGRTLPPHGVDPLLAERGVGKSMRAAWGRAGLGASVFLADAAALYARQRQRTWWFLGVVLASTLTAGVGLAAAYHAFERQLRLNELKSNFVSSVSHELRAPIASVRLLAESLDRGKITDEAKRRDYFRLIGQECRRLSSLIENVLDFSRIDQGRKQYDFEPTDVVALLTQTVRLMEPYATERQVDLRLHQTAAVDSHPVLDGKAIQQALVNLIDNAIKHSPPQAAVEIGLELVPSGNDAGAAEPALLAFSVADRGPGIPASEHARIFEPFYRRGSELRRETPGVGIGLSIVQHIVHAHRGRVRVGSEEGKGSRFVIELPVAECVSL